MQPQPPVSTSSHHRQKCAKTSLHTESSQNATGKSKTKKSSFSDLAVCVLETLLLNWERGSSAGALVTLMVWEMFYTLCICELMTMIYPALGWFYFHLKLYCHIVFLKNYNLIIVPHCSPLLTTMFLRWSCAGILRGNMGYRSIWSQSSHLQVGLHFSSSIVMSFEWWVTEVINANSWN